MSVDELKSLAGALGHPIYWAGPRPGLHVRADSGRPERQRLHPLPPARREVGDRRANYLTVATYPFPGAFAAVTKAARAAGSAATIRLADGGIGVVDGAYPKSIHLAYPGVNHQVEVYDPSPSAVRKLVASDAISPVS